MPPTLHFSLSKIKNHSICRYSTFPHSNPHAYHSAIVKHGASRVTHLVNYLLTLYLKTPCSDNARKLFDEIPQRDVKTWTILVSSFCRHGHHAIALDYFTKMQSEGTVSPNAFTLSSALKCCSSISDGLPMGKAVHGWMIRNGVRSDTALENAVLDLYAKFEMSEYVTRFFRTMSGEKDSTSWNIVMSAVLNKGDMDESLDFFWRLPIKNVSSWNTVVDGLMRRGFERRALSLLQEMVKVGPTFNGVTFSISLVLASSTKNSELGKQVHGRLLRVSVDCDSFVSAALLDMYCKCGEMEKASAIFQETEKRWRGTQEDLISQTVSWSTMISGYVQHGMIEDALLYFRRMMRKRTEVDVFTLTTIVVASADSAVLELGQQIHARTIKSGHVQDVFLCSSMIDMYAKCGKLDHAWSFFHVTQSRNTVIWSAMISSYGVHGLGNEAIRLFELMRSEGIRPNRVSFVGVLTACSHAGLVENGCEYFKMMREVYGIEPGVQHFSCMVDLFGRAGLLEEIKGFVYENGIHRIREIWKAYMSSCWLHKNVELTNWVSEKLLELDPNEPDSYLLASNTYSANHVWDEAEKVRGLMAERDVKKLPGQSWIKL